MPNSSPRVLLIDDNAEFAGLLGTLFAEQGLIPILAHTARDGEYLLAHYEPAAIVLDLLLPDRTGQKLLGMLAAQKVQLPPVFVMTGVFRGKQQRQRVGAIVPLAGWFEKPFDTRQLVEAVVAQTGRTAISRESHEAVGSISPDFDIQISGVLDMESYSAAPSDSEAAWSPLPISVRAPVDRAAIAKWALLQQETTDQTDALASPPVGPSKAASSSVAGDVTSDDGAVREEGRDVDSADMPTEVFSPPGLSAVPESFALHVEVEGGDGDEEGTETAFPAVEWLPLAPARIGDALGTATPSPELMSLGLRTNLRLGDLSSVPAPRLFNAFYLARETGQIVFERGNERKIVYLSEGRPVYAVSNQDSDRLGAMARKTMGVGKVDIERALMLAKGSDRMIGDVLVELGFLDEKARRELLHEQTRAIIRSLFTWEHGSYVIGFNVPANIDRIELKEHPGALVLAGVRDLFSLHRLQRLVPFDLHPMPSPSPPFELFELPLRDSEAACLLFATGQRSVAAIVESMREALEPRGVLALLYSLLLLEVLVAGAKQNPLVSASSDSSEPRAH